MNHPRTTVLALALTLALAVSLHPTSASAARVDRWDADLSVVDTDDVNVRHTRAGLRLVDARPPGAPARRSAVAEGMLVAAPRNLSRPATRIRAEVTVVARSGATASVQVRGWRAIGWTEWHDAVPAAVFDQPVRRVQARVVLTGSRSGATTEVRAVRLTADSVAATAATPGLTYRVYATRIGLVGEVTANGHTVRARDHFVALPSRRGLSPRNSGDYTLRVCTTNGSRCEYAPVWDVGPWNTRDDYWNPSGVRENWKDLPRGRPQAQAAYQNGYNGGRDQFGRLVLNPAGVDLADGTFWDGLQLTTNAWVDVAYLWTGTGPRGVVGDGPLNVRAGPGTGYASRGLAARYANVPLQCYVSGQTVAGPYRTTNRWNRLASGQFVSHAYISAVWGGSVPVC
ncbi:hypothetical protein SAMN05443287_101297 [Micromonospora phaseoli]|uniref:Secreted protein n=1 Tax=Micromonospora phaseoli TaxID=1144548 RepID=A0A1H6RKX6_9ACTN|nr:hypothetical protein [Micromonospora phaseoli]PZW03552.1 hypothetical protein CLV64_101297 [Micromonospora phaseoli]GIJ77118.1 hypothetical protein Xph01_15500 [Micromonospora phaseoli]SEI56451.1 hypothetical protein SAMN05443287_101297 [Micromonospora phaseoli]